MNIIIRNIKLVVKVDTTKTEEKTPYSKTRVILHPNNQNSIKSTLTMFQHMKIMPVLLLAQETSAKPITC